MVRYNQKELKYICGQFYKVLNDLRNIHKQTGVYKIYLIDVVRQHEKQIKYILRNFDKINNNKKINNITSNIVYDLWKMDNLVEMKYNKEKAIEFGIKSYGFHQIYFDMYGKILDDFNIVV